MLESEGSSEATFCTSSDFLSYLQTYTQPQYADVFFSLFKLYVCKGGQGNYFLLFQYQGFHKVMLALGPCLFCVVLLL